MTYQEKFLARHSSRSPQEQFRLAWIYSRHPLVRRLHNIAAIGGVGGERFGLMKTLAQAGFRVDPEIDGLGQDPLAVMKQRHDQGIDFVRHPDESGNSALYLPVPKPYIIPTVTELNVLLDRLVPEFDTTYLFVGGKALPVAGELCGPKISPQNTGGFPGHDQGKEQEAGWYYPGLDDNQTTGAFIEMRGSRFSKNWNSITVAEEWRWKEPSPNPVTS